MCGIVGVVGSNALQRARAMLPRISHRGPDGEGYWSGAGDIAFGHRRLAIVDLSPSGSQPMVSADERIVIVVNGEIYNYAELRAELENLGAVFRSSSDSEVVIHAWRYWSEQCFARFNGMFAVGLYDADRNLVVLARDRMGIKPLYYLDTADSLLFASEIKALTGDRAVTPVEIDPIGLNQYLTYQNYFGSRTLYRGIRLLEPGQILLGRPGSRARLESFWSLSFASETSQISFSEAVGRYRQTITEAVGRHLMSDVPVASYLSAGFDSATVANRAAHCGEPPDCFTGKFAEGGWYDETSMAAAMARSNGSRHRPVSISATDLTRVFDDLIGALDEPRMGMGAFPQYCVAEQVGASHKVILTGHGGDELFSGYPVFKFAHLLDKLTTSPLKGISLLSKLRFSEIPHLAYFGAAVFRPQRYRQYLPVLNGLPALRDGLQPAWADAIADLHPEDELVRLDQDCDGRSQILFRHYLQSYLHGLLVVEDKLSMAHSLESRTPLLDNAMVDLSVSLPQEIKIFNGELKAVVKEGGREWLPAELYRQPKRGFPTPLRFWLRGPLRDWCVSRIAGPESALRPLFRERWLAKVCHDYLASMRKNIRPLDEIQSHRMWQLLSLESWVRNVL